MEFLLIMVIITILSKCFTCIFLFNFYSSPVIDVLTLLHFISKKVGAEAVKGVKLRAKTVQKGSGSFRI